MFAPVELKKRSKGREYGGSGGVHPLIRKQNQKILSFFVSSSITHKHLDVYPSPSLSLNTYSGFSFGYKYEYGSMKCLIRLRSPGNDEEDEEGGSSGSDVEEHLEVERRLDHDLSRFVCFSLMIERERDAKTSFTWHLRGSFI